MRKFTIDFTAAEKRKLWKAKLSLRRLENYSIRVILDAVSPTLEREKEIRRQFFDYGEDGKLARGLEDIIGSSLRNNLIMGNSLGVIGAAKTAMDMISSVERMVPSNVRLTLDAVERSTSHLRNLQMDTFRDLNLTGMLGSSAARNLYESAASSRQVLDNFKPISERLRDITGSLSAFDRLQENSFLNLRLSSISKSYTGLKDLVSLRESILPKSLLQQDVFKKMEIGSLAGVLTASSLFEKKHISSVGLALEAASSYTRLAEINLAAFQWDSIGKRINLSQAAVQVAQKGFLGVSEGYSSLLRSISEKPNWIYEAPETAKIPAQDYYIGSRILKIVSIDDPEEVSEEQLDSEITEKNRDAISQYLPVVHKDLPDLWHGAVQAMQSDNPDKIRHVITSLRELYTHVLHLLAPDDVITKWDVNKEHYANGRPTRRGRFLYLCRNLNGSNSQFAKLLKTEIDATLAMIDLFQGGTHSIKSTFSPFELEFIKIKADTTLRTFLMLEFEINRR
ncbi:hypothetical protein [Pedobacter sp. R-06]|uniref:pPIWI-associating nuclease domain-containing protein n=1 Tax=Pedobacter sp. R-06 TaxID=3404051 RepID=UPI003CF16ECD